jgi:hypothetical protein
VTIPTPVDEYDIMRQRYCSYPEARVILDEMRAKDVEESLLRAEQEPPIEQVIEALNRKFAAETLMRVGATVEMVDAGVNAFVLTPGDVSELIKAAWDAMLKEATK